jgi:hypothetical protein
MMLRPKFSVIKNNTKKEKKLITKGLLLKRERDFPMDLKVPCLLTTTPTVEYTLRMKMNRTIDTRSTRGRININVS